MPRRVATRETVDEIRERGIASRIERQEDEKRLSCDSDLRSDRTLTSLGQGLLPVQQHVTA